MTNRQGPPNRVTIEDVANLCGLAVSTVSNALTGKRFVTEETRQKVLAAVEKLGYRASEAAKSLRRGHSSMVGLLIGDVRDPFFPEVVRGVEDLLSQFGYQVVLCNTDYQAKTQREYIATMIACQAAGLIFATQVDLDEDLELLRNATIPCTFINQKPPSDLYDAVYVDNVSGINQVLAHLKERGHRKVGFIAGRERSFASQQRREAFSASAEKFGFVGDPPVEYADQSVNSGYRAAKRLVTKKNKLTAVVASDDMLAIGAIAALSDLGYSVPSDVAVVGFDDIFISSLPQIMLTTVHQPKPDLGRDAARFLLDRINDQYTGKPRSLIFNPELIVRETS